MPDQIIQAHNIGTDASIMFKFPNGQVIAAENLAHVESFSPKRIQKSSEVTPMSNKGDVIRRSIPQGYEISMKYTRYNGNLTNVFHQMDEDYRANGLPAVFDMSVTVRNPDGSLNQGTFVNCIFENFGFGDFQGIDPVSQELTIKAQRYQQTK